MPCGLRGLALYLALAPALQVNLIYRYKASLQINISKSLLITTTPGSRSADYAGIVILLVWFQRNLFLRSP
ncbi:unnamed protein product [Protopolystoma xenopodis]|uniref:Uncharacterized protein n=1 Tax=Protopolystoma xenopodis TaxID=117903 RepID=A0A3S4ZJZ0_9PLAT|nr:unnamed protein product [Protopolystoma xenopodis]